MRKLILLALIVGAGAEDEPDRSWPREYEDKDKETAVVLYQPQVVEWKDYRVLKARAAVEVYYVGKEQPEFGAVELTITTATDHESRAVTLKKIDVSETSFPGLNNPSKAKSAVRRLLPKGPLNVELDRILTNLEQGQLRPKETKVRNNPPKIIVTTKEAILVVLGGEPLYERVPGTKLEVVANTESTLFRKGETHYMLYGAGWLEAAAVTGPWTPAGALPDDFQGLPSFWKDIQSKIPGMPLKAEDVPEIHVVWQSTELIVLDGEPDLKKIPKTNLLYVANTESDRGCSNTDKKWYFLVSGRWFRAQDLKAGPWFYCTQTLLPDFGRIPEDHTCGRVLVSVPGTDQAQESLIEAHIPRTATIQRGEVTLEVTYDGEPEFEPIEDIGVSYAVNTSYDVLQVGELYYCCYEAVWFVAKSPNGPWQVADAVPDAIYKIPPDHPLYRVTFVYVYSSDDEEVYCGYLPGYWGGYIYGGVIVYGTGYWYRHRRRAWRHWWRWHAHRPRPHPYRHRRTYGHGRYYDHLSGRYRTNARSLQHRASRTRPSGVYGSWNRGVKRHQAQVKLPAKPVAKPRAHVKPGRDLYAGPNGQVYRKQGNNWQRYHNGKWTNTSRPQQAKKPQTHAQRSNLHRASRSRTAGAKRSSQYRSYRSSRGTRSRSYRSSGGRRGGGGGRGGGGRR
ncbi:MAG: hypothetical protein ACYTGK_16460 [Planctomycetota bacterium]|jgi:hypothetical protein